ncbi:hypothetical protein H2204_013482 [Knufia peltigerae]|uniref:Altered inheritance of mitochondria protein 32 n=1 Tax=Knufia peltigerae TaxID=1002370 RepID=A0AA39CRY4_9EURO|nr:hypothetical protein H2204_013482 [Knufia peltigerae]
MPPMRLARLHHPAPCVLRTSPAAQRATLKTHAAPAPFPVIPTCPDPTCPCSSMPAGLDIDRKAHLSGTMSAHSQHLIVSTGRSDWTSRIENERDTAVWGRFTADVKSMMGRRGEFFDPYHNDVMVSTSSFAPLEVAEREAELQRSSGTPTATSVQAQKTVDAILFPAFKHFRGLSTKNSDDGQGKTNGDSNNARTLIKSFLLPEKDKLNAVHNHLSESERGAKSRDPSLASSLDASTVQTPTILICSHGQRDHRCGVLGPLLHDEFARYISCRDPIFEGGMGVKLEAVKGAFVSSSLSSSASTSTSSSSSTNIQKVPVNIGMISHVGGHKWAGNVIIYVPPGARQFLYSPGAADAVAVPPIRHPLAGEGIWYGRVEPKHVEGIIEQTLLRGNVIRDLFRGGLSAHGDVLRL